MSYLARNSELSVAEEEPWSVRSRAGRVWKAPKRCRESLATSVWRSFDSAGLALCPPLGAQRGATHTLATHGGGTEKARTPREQP
jgi:hypothetical protein